MNATMEVDQGAVEAVDGADGEPMPKRPRHAAFASSSSPSSLKQQLSQLTSELSQAVRVLVEADKKADEREQEEEEEEEQGVEPIDASKKPSTSSPSTTLTAPRAAPEVSAAASALEQLLRALSQARKERGESAVPGGIERALDEWREGVEVKKGFFSIFLDLIFFFSPLFFPLACSPFTPLLLLSRAPSLPPLSRSTAKASCSRLQDLLDASPAPPGRHPSLRALGGGRPPPAAAVAAVACPLARRLGFTSRAPSLGWRPGQPLPPGGSRPPAPQEWQIRASGLRRLCGKEEENFFSSLSVFPSLFSVFIFFEEKRKNSLIPLFPKRKTKNNN